MRITVLIEGKTERAFMSKLREFLHPRLPGRMPKLDPMPFDGRIPKEGKLLKAFLNTILTLCGGATVS